MVEITVSNPILHLFWLQKKNGFAVNQKSLNQLCRIFRNCSRIIKKRKALFSTSKSFVNDSQNSSFCRVGWKKNRFQHISLDDLKRMLSVGLPWYAVPRRVLYVQQFRYVANSESKFRIRVYNLISLFLSHNYVSFVYTRNIYPSYITKRTKNIHFSVRWTQFIYNT